jgi:DNA helicase IV
VLRLPTYEELSKEQQHIFDLPLEGSHLVTGPPGSGKTIMAIYRAEMLHQGREEPTLLLMYSRLLSRYSQAAVKALKIESIVRNYHSWFRDWFSDTYGQLPPREGRYGFDWHECFQVITRSPPPPKLRPHLIIDEGQDMPKEFYAVLRMIARTMTVFADENQQLTEDRSTIDEIQATAGITSMAHLARNFRNTRAIAAVAATFYTGAGAAPAELRDDALDGDHPVLDADIALHATVTRLVNYEKAHSRQQIGVFVPYIDQLRHLYNRLQGKTKNPVQIYLSTDMGLRKPIDFSKPGIKLVSYVSAKGLEFDTVFLPELQANRSDPEGVGFRMNMYVMASRACSELYFLYSGKGEPEVVRTLPLGLMDDWRD